MRNCINVSKPKHSNKNFLRNMRRFTIFILNARAVKLLVGDRTLNFTLAVVVVKEYRRTTSAWERCYLRWVCWAAPVCPATCALSTADCCVSTITITQPVADTSQTGKLSRERECNTGPFACCKQGHVTVWNVKCSTFVIRYLQREVERCSKGCRVD